MLELDRDSLELQKSSATSNPRYRHAKIFNITFLFKKYGSGKHVSWSTKFDRFRSSSIDVNISHSGKLTWYSLKKTLELYLNYPSSHLRKVIIKEIIK